VYVFARGGTILVEKDGYRKSSLLARETTGFNLTIYLNKQGQKIAKGYAYFDDGESFNYQRLGEFEIVTFIFDPSKGLLQAKMLNHKSNYNPYTSEHDKVSKVEIVGFTEEEMASWSETAELSYQIDDRLEEVTGSLQVRV
jgi:hypothetical protein